MKEESRKIAEHSPALHLAILTLLCCGPSTCARSSDNPLSQSSDKSQGQMADKPKSHVSDGPQGEVGNKPQAQSPIEPQRDVSDKLQSQVRIVAIPADARVFLGPASLRASVKNPMYGFKTHELFVGSKYLRGDAPLTVDLPPGNYQLGLATRAITDEARAFKKKWSSTPGETWISGSMFLSKSRVKDVIEMVVKDRQLLMVGKICKITVKAGQPQDLRIALFDF